MHKRVGHDDDPTREHAHRRLMRLHYLRDDRAAALAAYQRYRQLLKLQLRAPLDRSGAAQEEWVRAELARLLPERGDRWLRQRRSGAYRSTASASERGE